MNGLLANAEAEVKSMVRLCTCGTGYRVAGLEYDTGGCMDRSEALAIARNASAIGVDEWRRCYAVNLNGERKRYR